MAKEEQPGTSGLSTNSSLLVGFDITWVGAEPVSREVLTPLTSPGDTPALVAPQPLHQGG